MKFYIDCVSGYSFLINSSIIDNDDIIDKFEDCFIDGCVKSQCGRNIIELQVLLKNISNTMKSIDENDISYHTLRSILDLTLNGIASIPGNCADNSNYYKPEKSKRTPKKKVMDANFEWNNAITKLREKRKI